MRYLIASLPDAPIAPVASRYEMQVSTSLPWWAQFLAALMGLLGSGGLGGFITARYLKRKADSEAAKNDADADSTRVDGYIRASEHLLRRLKLLEAADMRREEEFQESQRYYRKWLDYHEALDLAYRNRSHAINGEQGRLVLKVRELEARLAETGQTIMPMQIRTQDEIVKEFPLPIIPEN